MDVNDNQLLPIGEASEYVGVSVDTLRRWVKKGKLRTFRSPGGHRYFLRENLAEVFGKKYERDPETKPRKEYETGFKEEINTNITNDAASADNVIIQDNQPKSEEENILKSNIEIPKIETVSVAPVAGSASAVFQPVMPHLTDDIPPISDQITVDQQEKTVPEQDIQPENETNDIQPGNISTNYPETNVRDEVQKGDDAEKTASSEVTASSVDEVMEVEKIQKEIQDKPINKSILEPEIKTKEDKPVVEQEAEKETAKTQIKEPLRSEKVKNQNVKIFAITVAIVLLLIVVFIVILTYPSKTISPIP